MLYIRKTPYDSYCISADSNRELARSFLRFQEYYESPNDKFRGQIFTIGQYRYWYEQKYGYFSYDTDWTGFNIPSYILEPFKSGLFDPLTPEEKNLISLFSNTSLDKFYIIGANDRDTLNHELNHALYAYSTTYSNEVNKIFDANLEKIKYAMEYLLNKGYCRYLLYDELQAYLLDNDQEIISLINDNTIVYAIHSLYLKFSEKQHYET
jgi:hypothetical protein